MAEWRRPERKFKHGGWLLADSANQAPLARFRQDPDYMTDSDNQSKAITTGIDADDPCRYCESSNVVPVLRKQVEESPSRSNPYWRYCLNCTRWLSMTSEYQFKESHHPYILPIDHEVDGPEGVIPLSDYDYGPEWEELVERVQSETVQAADPEPPETEDDRDPGERPGPNGETGHLDTRGQSDDGGEAVADGGAANEFDCPECGEHLTGYPEECPACEAVYVWTDDEEDT